MMIFHDAMKVIPNWVCVLFLNKRTKPVSFQKKPRKRMMNNILLKRIFLNPDYLSILFCNFPLIARSGTSHVIISLIGCALQT